MRATQHISANRTLKEDNRVAAREQRHATQILNHHRPESEGAQHRQLENIREEIADPQSGARTGILR